MPAAQLVLGIGAGHCGLNLLADLLSRQPSTRMSHEQRPLLPWISTPDDPRIAARFARWREGAQERVIGDAAAFYLPYLEAAFPREPTLKVVCLERPVTEIVATFCRQLDHRSPTPINNWSASLPPGWTSDPQWAASFPKYDTPDRIEALTRYCKDYYATARRLQERYAQQMLWLDPEELTQPAGVERLLDFVGYPRNVQRIVTGQKPKSASRPPVIPPPPQPKYPDPLDPRRCVILVPFQGFIHTECDEALKQLERRGYQVRRVAGYAAIDQGRNQMATDALLDGFEETLWIDSDVAFRPDDVERLRRHALPMVCGIYPQKGRRALACHVAQGTPQVTFGKNGGLIEIGYAGTGFLLVRREVYLAVQQQLQLPLCNERFGQPMIPFFQPLVRTIEDGAWYLAEDYAFCERARRCGYQVWADSSIRLWHIGNYRYGWEDAGIDRPRFDTFTLNFGEPPRTSGTGDSSRVTALQTLARQAPWPQQRPVVETDVASDWGVTAPSELLNQTVTAQTAVILELGAAEGQSTRVLTELAPRAAIIASDAWETASTPTAFDQFCARLWDQRQRLIPLRLSGQEAVRAIYQLSLQPDLIWLSLPEASEVGQELLDSTVELFPGVPVLGTGWDQPTTRQAVEQVAALRRLKFDIAGTTWRVIG